MAGVLFARSIQPAFLSPHRKRKWRRRRVSAPLASALFAPRGCRIDRKRELDGGLRIGGGCVGWRSRTRGKTVIDVAWSVGACKSRLVMSAFLGIDHVVISDMSLDLAPVESASLGASLLGGDLVSLSHFLVSPVFDSYVQLGAFILGVLVLARLAGDGDGRGRGRVKSLEVVSRPSPFNVFVSKRCPSISSPFASLAFGRKGQIGGDESRPVYQRKCLPAADGGVVAIDWPAQLDLAGEDGCDSVLLLVPGTTEGSRDDGVEKFVMDVMRLGYFPIVLNPRGCGGSPLTTPRVFTAADSDDVRLVILHIMCAQPRAMVMGVGWGFGANMLAKYLGEEASSTALVAAVCISNPFDLQKTSRHLSSIEGGKFDRAMADGLIGILEANKMLFVGEKKGYDLNKALAATSVREFEAAISRVAYGFETLEGFYATASSINSISTVQTPLLFIQGEDGAIPVLMPRETIEANPYTTAIVAQFPTNTAIAKEETLKEPGSASRHDWSHTIALEWLAAVELALLKGRHPCLDAVSVRGEVEENVSVSSGLPSYGQTEDKKPALSNSKLNAFELMTEQTTTGGGQEHTEVAPRSKLNTDAMGQEKAGLMVDGSENGPVPRLDNVDEDDSEILGGLNRTRVSHEARGQEKGEMVVDGAENGIITKAGDSEAKEANELDGSASSEEPNGASEEEAAPPEGEPEESPDVIQMRMAAESIMNVLDITMPGTLTDEKKTEVLTAVGRGDTILTALQEAVPEDVRGNMATAVSGAVQARGLSFNLVGFGKNIPPPRLPAGLISSIKGKLEAGSGGKEETVAASPVSESPPTSTGESQKQNQEGHESGNNKSGDHSEESGRSEKLKIEEPKLEEHGPLDPQNSNATTGDGSSDQGHASETSDSKIEKGHDNGAKVRASEIEEKEKSDKEKGSPEGATNDLNRAEEDIPKDPNAEVSNLKERSEGKLEGGKSEEHTEKLEKSDNKGVETKDGGRKALDDQTEQKNGKQPSNSKDSNELGVEESKPEGAEGNKPEAAKEENNAEGVEESKPEAAKGESKPEAEKEDTKPEGGNLPSPGTPDPVTTAFTPSPAPAAPPPIPNPTPDTTGMAPPVDMRLALEALTGFDDSTQMAVTNVFGVVESMLEQLEKDQQDTGPDSSNRSKGVTPDQEQENEKEKSDGEKENRDEGQKRSGPDSSDGSEIPTADYENKRDQGVSDSEIEQREKQQKAPERYSPASELSGDDGSGSGMEKANRLKSKSTCMTHHEDKERVAAASLNKNLANVDECSKSQDLDGAEKNSSAKGVASETEEKKIDEPEDASDDNQKFHEPPFPLSFECDRDSVHRSYSKVLTTCRVGSSIFVTTASNFGVPQVTNGIHAGQNVTSSGFVDTSRDFKGVIPKEDTSNGAGPQIHKLEGTKCLSRDVKVTKVVPHKMTMEQLMVEVDRESQLEPDKDEGTQGSETIEVEATGIKRSKSPNTVENMISNALKLEVLRRLGVAGMESLGVDLENEVAKVADAIARAVQKWKQEPGGDGSESGKLGILESDSIVDTLGSAVSRTSILGGLVPIGVLAGVVLASLGAVYLIVTDQQGSKKVNDEEGEDDDDDSESVKEEENRSEGSSWDKAKVSAVDVPVLSVNGHAQMGTDEPVEGSFDFREDQGQGSEASDNAIEYEKNGSEEPTETSRDKQTGDSNNNKLNGMMAAAVAGGATLAGMTNNGTATNGQDNRVTDNEKAGTERKSPSIVSSFHPLAEKALSVAAPVVPTNEDGEVDHERLVAMLADLGQRGGFFRLVGKIALLWGGLRGAMSLTDRLLLFLRMKERPLYLRLVGFAAMTVLLWSPVLVPVLPSFLQQWATKSPNGVANAASVVGLYGAVLILITIWGKRVRGYKKPLLYYGLRLYSRRKVRDIISGLAFGCALVTALYTTNAFLGYVQFDWKALLATNTKLFSKLLPDAVGVTIFTTMKMFRLLGLALGIGLAVALVEEVLFRSWLQEEIAVDFGFHGAVFLSALVFSLIHWSPAAMPGHWFLAVALAGARAQTGRNLAYPIGLHAGLVAANYAVTVGGVVRFLPHAPTWFTGAHAGNPLAGALGTAMTAMLAVILYPRSEIRPPAAAVPIDSAKEVGTEASPS